jgi:hypothetical protein
VNVTNENTKKTDWKIVRRIDTNFVQKKIYLHINRNFRVWIQNTGLSGLDRYTYRWWTRPVHVQVVSTGTRTSGLDRYTYRWPRLVHGQVASIGTRTNGLHIISKYRPMLHISSSNLKQLRNVLQILEEMTVDVYVHVAIQVHPQRICVQSSNTVILCGLFYVLKLLSFPEGIRRAYRADRGVSWNVHVVLIDPCPHKTDMIWCHFLILRKCHQTEYGDSSSLWRWILVYTLLSYRPTFDQWTRTLSETI